MAGPPEGYTDLGFINGWANDSAKWPKAYLKCEELGHKREVHHDYQRCRTRSECHECKIFWQIDSSD